MTGVQRSAPRGELRLRGGERVAEVKHTVHVGIGERGHETTRQVGRKQRTEAPSYQRGRQSRRAFPFPTAPAFSAPFRGDGLFSQKTTCYCTKEPATLAPIYRITKDSKAHLFHCCQIP